MLLPLKGYIVNKHCCDDILHTRNESGEPETGTPKNSFHFSTVMEEHTRESTIAAYFRDAEDRGIYNQTSQAAYFAYRQTFMYEGQKTVRNSIVANIDMASAHDKIIRHERTFPVFVQKKVALLKEKFNIYPITCFFTKHYQSVISAINEATWTHVYHHNGVLHEFGQIPEKHNDKLHTQHFDELFLADGHHRYDAMMQLHHSSPKEYRYLLGCFMIPSTDYPMQPIHRMVKLKKRIDAHYISNYFKKTIKNFIITEKEGKYPDIATHSYQIFTREYSCALHFQKEKAAELLEKTEKHIFGKLFENNILYVHYNPQLTKCIDSINEGDYDIMLSPPIFDLQDLLTFCKSGKWLPEKTTHLYPKIPGGFLAGKVDNNN